jgi:phosphoribosyl-ATP pyrophosphohydrolase
MASWLDLAKIRASGRKCPSPSNLGHTLTSTPMPQSLEPLDRLMKTLAERARTLPEGSYTTKLLKGGVPAIGAKVVEEAAEMVEAAAEVGDAGRAHFVYETGDLLYHTFALMAYRGVSLDEVAAELARREGTSGLAEKSSRKPN